MRPRTALITALLVALAGCAASPPLEERVELPETWRSELAQDAARDADAPHPPGQAWWDAGESPELALLIEAVLAGNLEYAAAHERLTESRALLREARARALPHLNLGGARARQRSGLTGEGFQSLIVPDTNSWEVALQEEWSADLFGATRARLGGAERRLVAEEAAVAGLRLSLAAAAANGYIEVRQLQAESAALAASIELARTQERVAARLFEAGEATRLDEDMAAADRLALEAELAAVEAGIGTALLALETLVGGDGETLLAALEAPAPMPRLDDGPPLGQPADLLLRRPDLLQALALLEAAEAESRAARRDRFPQLVLSGLLGRQGLTMNGDALGSGTLSRASVALVAPLFDFGARRAAIEGADARTRQLLFALEHAMLEALEDVEAALLQRELLGLRERQLNEARDLRGRALERALLLQRAGEADLLLVLDARRRLTEAELAHARAEAELARASVRLYSALGGGWGGYSNDIR